MDRPRKIGVATVMIIPTFVGVCVLWDMVHRWIAVLVWTCLLAATYAYVVRRRGN